MHWGNCVVAPSANNKNKLIPAKHAKEINCVLGDHFNFLVTSYIFA